MEHTQLGFFLTKLSRLATILLVATCFSACDKRLENPENEDPIYKSLQDDQKAAEAAVEAAKKELEETLKQSEDQKLMSKLRMKLRSELFQKQARIKILEEKALYQTLLVNKRLEEARQEYDKAYRAGKPWPDPGNYDRFKATERLKNAPRNWGSRVPKMPKPGEKKAAPPAHGGGEGGEKPAEGGGGHE